MNNMKKIIIWIFSAFFAVNTMLAAEFQNLGFEEARIDNLQPDPLIVDGWIGSVSDLLPGWSLTLGAEPVDILRFNAPDHVIGTLAIVYNHDYFYKPMEGEFGLYFSRGSEIHFAITQTGEIPLDRPWLTYTYRRNPFRVLVNGMEVDYQFGSENPQSVAIDLSDFAGQTVELSIQTHSPILPGGGDHHLDGIAFVVPEPSTVSLLLIGSAALAGGWILRRCGRGD